MRVGRGLFEFMICRDFVNKAAVVNHCHFRCTVMTFMLWRGTWGGEAEGTVMIAGLMSAAMTSHNGAVQQPLCI